MSFLEKIADKLRGGKSVRVSSEALTEALVKETVAQVIAPGLDQDIVSLGFIKKINIVAKEVSLFVEPRASVFPSNDALAQQIEAEVGGLPQVSAVKVHFTSNSKSNPPKSKSEPSHSLGSVRNIVAIASGKGGVGKSTSAVNLAYCLVSLGAKVGIMDADIYGPSIPKMTGAYDPSELQGNLVVPPIINGVKVVSFAMFSRERKANIMRGPMTAQIIKQFVSQVAWGELDYLLIDYPPGTGDIQLSLSQLVPITAAVIVTTPQEVALIDVRKAIEMFKVTNVPILGVLETMSYFICDDCEKKHVIFGAGGADKLSAEEGLRVLGRIPVEQAVSQSSDSGEPLIRYSPGSKSALAYSESAGKLASQLSILSSNNPGEKQGFNLSWGSRDGG